jgi:hypothetical protein
MARTVEQGFAEFASRLTPTSTERDAAVRHRRSVEKALSERLEVVTFLQTGSFWHGTGVRGHADIDLLVWLKFQSQPTSSYDALTFVEKSLAAAFPSTSVYISRPAVVVNFANGDERWEVIPGYTTGQDDVVEIPSGEFGGGWMNTSPSGHFRYVNEANSSPRPAGTKVPDRTTKAFLAGMGVSSGRGPVGDGTPPVSGRVTTAPGFGGPSSTALLPDRLAAPHG